MITVLLQPREAQSKDGEEGGAHSSNHVTSAVVPKAVILKMVNENGRNVNVSFTNYMDLSHLQQLDYCNTGYRVVCLMF